MVQGAQHEAMGANHRDFSWGPLSPMVVRGIERHLREHDPPDFSSTRGSAAREHVDQRNSSVEYYLMHRTSSSPQGTRRYLKTKDKRALQNCLL